VRCNRRQRPSLNSSFPPPVHPLYRSAEKSPLVTEAPIFTTDFVAAWVDLHRNQIGGSELRLIRNEQYGRTLCWEFETASHYVQFLAWDHAFCLDLLALNKDSGANDFVVAGSCEDITCVNARLDSFVSWMQTNPAYSTALP
jgi:hypothetical protein